jgi:hypothetical protein
VGDAGGVACAHLSLLVVKAGLPVPVYIGKTGIYSRCAASAEVIDAKCHHNAWTDKSGVASRSITFASQSWNGALRRTRTVRLSAFIPRLRRRYSRGNDVTAAGIHTLKQAAFGGLTARV